MYIDMIITSSNSISELINESIVAVLKDDAHHLSVLIGELDMEMSPEYITDPNILSISEKVSICESWLINLGIKIEADSFFIWNFKSFLLDLAIKSNRRSTVILLLDMLSVQEKTNISSYFEKAITSSSPDSLDILIDVLLDGDVDAIIFPKNRDLLTLALTTPCGKEKWLNYAIIYHIIEKHSPSLDGFSSRISGQNKNLRVHSTEIESSLSSIILSQISDVNKVNAVRIALLNGALIQGIEGSSILTPLESAVSVSKPLAEYLLVNAAELNIHIDYELLLTTALTSPITHLFEKLSIADLLINGCHLSEESLFNLVERIMISVRDSQVYDILIYLVQQGYSFEEEKLLEIAISLNKYTLIRMIHDNAYLFT